jgi:hypothetical protein
MFPVSEDSEIRSPYLASVQLLKAVQNLALLTIRRAGQADCHSEGIPKARSKNAVHHLDLTPLSS